MAHDLHDLRASLDNIDNALVFLLAERFRITHKVGLLKKEQGLPSVDEAREASQYARIDKLAGDTGLNQQFAQKFLELIITEVRANHEHLRRG